MKKPVCAIAIMIAACSCSSTSQMSLSVKEPAPVTLPSSIKSVAIVNRTEASGESREDLGSSTPLLTATAMRCASVPTKQQAALTLEEMAG